MTNVEIAKAYRFRWKIELSWKFLKSYLKLDELINNNHNRVMIKIIVLLISYLILKLLEISKIYERN